MPIESKHPQYKDNYDDWCQIEDVVAGERAIKEAGTTYLPKLGGMTPTEYKSYCNRAAFYNATQRTVSGLTGALMRRDPAIEVPEQMTQNLKDCTLDGLTIKDVMRGAAEGILSYGRYGILVDFATDAQKPYMAEYNAKDILNWRTRASSGQQILVMLTLRETKEQSDLDDMFETDERELIRHLFIDPIDGTLTVQLFEKQEIETRQASGQRRSKSRYEWVQIEVLPGVYDAKPSIKGVAMDYIPFVFFGPIVNVADVDKSPILDLVNLNLYHWKMSADQAHGLHFCALPTIWGMGFKKQDKIEVGPGRAILNENPDAKVGMLEFTGQGLGAVDKNLTSTEQKMAVLGARLLEEQKRGVEAAETLRLRSAGDSATLSSIAGALDSGFVVVLTFMAEWLSLSTENISVRTNRDYLSIPINPQLITSLLQSLQAGKISHDTFLYQLKIGEILPPDRTIEDEILLIEAQESTGFEDAPIDTDVDTGDDDATANNVDIEE